MTEDKNTGINLKYLDDVLAYLINYAHGYQLEFKSLYKYKIGRDLDEDNENHAKGYYKALSDKTWDELFSISNNTYAQAEKLVEAMYFLHTNDYIRLDVNFNAKVTYKGIIQYSKGFLAEHKREHKAYLYNKWNIMITIVISLLALIAGILFAPTINVYTNP